MDTYASLHDVLIQISAWQIENILSSPTKNCILTQPVTNYPACVPPLTLHHL